MPICLTLYFNTRLNTSYTHTHKDYVLTILCAWIFGTTFNNILPFVEDCGRTRSLKGEDNRVSKDDYRDALRGDASVCRILREGLCKWA